MTRTTIGILLALLLVPALAVADPSRYMGDDGSYSPDKAYDRTGGNGASGMTATGSATNLVNDLAKRGSYGTPSKDNRGDSIVYQAWARNAQGALIQPLSRITVTIGPVAGSNPPVVIPTATQWLAFLRDRLPRSDGQADADWNGVPDASQPGGALAVKPLSADPPRNDLLVVDQGTRKQRIDAGQPPEAPVQRLQTVVSRWTEAIPVYQNRSVVGYPCCCTITFSLLVGYSYVPHVDVSYRLVNVAEYPTTEIAVDRGIIVSQGSPQYSTQIPRLCEFTYGAGAKFVAPVVPLVTNVNDLRDLQTVTSNSQAGNVTTYANTLGYASNGSSYIQDLSHNTIAQQGTSSVTLAGAATATSMTEPITEPLVPGSGPAGTNYGGVTLAGGNTTRVVDPVASDRGTFTNSGDKAYVVDAITGHSTTSSNDPYDYHNK